MTIERELTPSLVATIAYVGNNAKHTFAGTGPLGSSCHHQQQRFRQQPIAFPSIASDNADEQWIGESMYNSLQAKLEKRYSNGLSFLASYTWSHAEDDASNPGIGGGPRYRNTNLIPLKDEFTNSNYDIRHRVTLNGMYDLPFGKGRKYMHQGGVLDYLVGGWSTSLTWTAQTGIPFTITTGSNFQGANGFNQYNAIKVGDPFKGGGSPPAANADMQGSTCPASVKTKTNWYNPCAFVDPAPGANIPVGTALTDLASAIEFSGSKSNQLPGPGWERINMSGFKNFKTIRDEYIQFRADAFNLFNHPSWGQPDCGNGYCNLDPSGGLIDSTQGFQNYTPDARFFQLAAKYVF